VEISKISKSGKGMIGRPKKKENLIVHCVVNTNAVRNEEITLNEKEHDWKFIFAAMTSILMLKKMLYRYKKQSKMKKGYLIWTKVLGSLRFIPKKPPRIEELSMIRSKIWWFICGRMEAKKKAEMNSKTSIRPN
jgi:hypothetical protein